MTAYSTPELLDSARNTRATRTWTRVQPTTELNIRRSGTAATVTTDNSIITSSTRKEYCVRRASRMLERVARCLRSAVSTSINLRQTSCVAWLDHFTHTIGSGEILHVHQRRCAVLSCWGAPTQKKVYFYYSYYSFFKKKILSLK